MRPTSPEREAFRLFNACTSADDVAHTRAALVDDVTHAESVGYGIVQARALLTAYDAVLTRHDLDGSADVRAEG